jgi:hypothetical protein
MMLLLKFLLSAGATLLAFGIWKTIEFFYTQYKSPLRALPGPKSSGFIFGNLKEIIKAVSL